MSFKKLNLDNNKVDTYLSNAKDDGSLISSDKRGTALHCTFVKDESPCLLILYLKTDGTSTLQFSVGKNQELSKTIAEEIISQCNTSDNKTASYTFKKITKEDFALVQDFVRDEIDGAILTIKKDNDTTKQISAEGLFNDKATITYYKTTGTVLLQGRPLPILQVIKLFFYEIIPTDAIIANENQVYSIDITKDVVMAKLKAYLPTAFNFLDKKVIKILSPSLALDCVDIALDDYSSFSFPLLRGMEGYVRQLVKYKSPKHKNTGKLGSLFNNSPGDQTFYLQDFIKKDIGCTKTEEAIETAYNLYRSKRHPYFHIDKHIESAPIIENKQAAQALNVEILSTIEATFCLLPQEK